jgi:hypothetical protein
MNEEDQQLVIGALDSLGCALADHNHQWTEGERAIYEAAVSLCQKAKPARASVNDDWLNCQRCGERPRHFVFHDALKNKECWIVRPARRSKCKLYSPGVLITCQITNYDSEMAARKEWNDKNGL